jgi:hypothetical protein
MTELQKRDVSISMDKANLYGSLFFALPTAAIQSISFHLLHGSQSFTGANLVILALAIVAGIVIHEIIHGFSWAFLGKKPLSAIQLGFQWKTLTPYAHVKEPLEVNAYRLGTFMPGLLLGLLPFAAALLSGNNSLYWFSLLHTVAACGDWLVLWVIRGVKAGALVEDHPSNAGCYVLEPAP